MTTKNLNCGSCESEFKITHNMDTGHYTPQFCPFCGEPLEIDHDLDVEFLEETDE